MIGWLIFGGYLAIALVTWRWFALQHIEAEARRRLADREEQAKHLGYSDPEAWIAKQGKLVPDYERDFGVAMGALAGVGWPLFWVGLGVVFLLALTTRGMTAPTELAMERRIAQHRELEALRKLAREHNLPMPGGDA